MRWLDRILGRTSTEKQEPPLEEKPQPPVEQQYADERKADLLKKDETKRASGEGGSDPYTR